ncbi:MAG: hypothetical protein SFW36_17800 [Leptolyngbyaceae cyanobacterium bins.59]|nr:hypothetical protein [Leptolyngbyaceae cyanobacterium bins.59]
MTGLNTSTRRRLRQLSQIPSVWEGDRRLFSTGSADRSLEAEPAQEGDCILWVDRSQGVVRSMDMVPPDMGPEAIVRTLLRAMEQPHNPAKPARPQKIVVRDREVQFYLRGVLQELGITVEYMPELPLIDEIFRSFQDVVNSRPPQLPPALADRLNQQAHTLWKDAPWEYLEDSQIIAIELNTWDIETLYLSIMGNMGMEYGILLYRSLDSLKQFRQRALQDEDFENMEEAFLQQDCLFLTYEAIDDEEEEPIDLATLPPSEIQPNFGNLHPLEGLRSFLHEEETLTLSVALEALHRFFQQHRRALTEEFIAVNGRYRIPIPIEAKGLAAEGAKTQISVQVSTLPDLSQELQEMAESLPGASSFPVLRDDLVPEGALRALSVIEWETLEQLRSSVEVYQGAATPILTKGDGLPIILVQTSQPKAKTLIQNLQEAGGLKAICFNPGEDPFSGSYDLGLLLTDNGELHLFAEFADDDPSYKVARKQWQQRCKKTRNACGLVIAKGVTGASRGNPKPKDMLALYETQVMTTEELGLGPLELRFMIDWV